MNMKNAMPAGRQGFTLIELLVAISIISILTIITVSQFQGAKKKANDVARKGDLNSTSKALQMYYTDYGVFPAPSSYAVPNGWGGTFQDVATPPYVYMKKLPIENYLTAKPYCYVTKDLNKKYALFAQLETTTDKECAAPAYTCNGVAYCYGVTSPNTSLTEMDGL